MQNRIFSMDNPKAAKAKGYGYLNAIHYMAPHKLAGVGNLCPHATPGCAALCLGWESGHAGMVSQPTQINSVRQSRIDKATRFMRDRQGYLEDMIKAIVSAKNKAKREGLKLCVRLNGSTDIGWEGIATVSGMTLLELFPDVQFVDYTKSKRRALNHALGMLPSNYHLTFSRSETNEDDCHTVLANGGTVAVVFANGLPNTYFGVSVVNGDDHDLRHLDPKGAIIGLSPKGHNAKADISGFVVR